MRRRRLPFPEDGDEESLINLTTLIDVVFILLITFMLIAPILKVDKVELAPGGVASQREASHTPLVLTLKSDDTLWFQGRVINLTKMGELFQKFPGQIPQLIADKNAHFGTYQEVKNRLEESGFEQLDVILK